MPSLNYSNPKIEASAGLELVKCKLTLEVPVCVCISQLLSSAGLDWAGIMKTELYSMKIFDLYLLVTYSNRI